MFYIYSRFILDIFKIYINNINSINNKMTSLDKTQNKTLSLWFYIKSALTFRYISNLSIIVCILSYYMEALDIFFIFAPLVFVNLFVIVLILINDFDALITGILSKILPEKKDRDKQSYLFGLFIILWHTIPVLWIMYIFQSQDIIKIFHPNFMSIFLKSLILPMIYYYFEIDLKVYGNINYLFYLVIYIIMLLAICIYLYN
jgi:hypothetical protein